MTKQEEVFYVLQDIRLGELSEYEATLKLKELGVVIKVDRELPDTRWKQGSDRDSWKRQGQKELLEAGYVAVESLI